MAHRRAEGATGARATDFLPAERAGSEELKRDLALTARSPVVGALLESWGGSLAILNRRRQIIAINTAYLELLGVAEASAVLGMRPGEAVHCRHAHDRAAGCGTGRACTTCGAAISIVSALQRGEPCERECALTAAVEGGTLELDLKVRAAPLQVEGRRFVILTLADISAEKRRAALERAFFHDLSNVVAGLCGASFGLDTLPPDELHDAAQDVQSLSNRISREIQVQRALADGQGRGYTPVSERVSLAQLAEAMRALFQYHPVAVHKILEITPAAGEVWTDAFLLQRVLTNMLVNAFEATGPGGVVRLGLEQAEACAHLRVWSAAPIPPGVAERVFQRYFSTKPGLARGQGTYIMKLFGERFMGGQVAFTTSAEAGTSFSLALPRRGAPPATA
jgi:signal transduction histidine kinase